MATTNDAGSDIPNLVLRLKLGERIIIEEGRIVVTLVAQGHEGIKLAFEAAREISIDREKVHLDKMAERAGRK